MVWITMLKWMESVKVIPLIILAGYKANLPFKAAFQSKTLIFLKEYDNIGTILSEFTIM